MRFTLIKAGKSDIMDVYKLSNSKEVRKASFNSDFIVYEDHRLWYEKIIKDKDILFYLVRESELLAAQIRYQKIDDKTCKINISVSEKYRSKGFLSDVLLLSEKKLSFEWEVEKIVAEIKADNLRSINFFLKNNYLYQKTYIKDLILCKWYEKKI